jgi:hypothetical protein
MNTFNDKKPTYQFGNEFNAEDMFTALIGYGTPSQAIIDKWRIEEEERLGASASGKLSHWRLRFGKRGAQHD